MKKLLCYSLAAAFLPSAANASMGAEHMFFLLHVILPLVVLGACFVVETLGATLMWKVKLWYALTTFFFANLAAAAVFSLISLSATWLLSYLKADDTYMLIAPLVGVLIAYKVKFSMSQQRLRRTSKSLIGLFMLSHPLALAALYCAHSYYTQIASATY